MDILESLFTTTYYITPSISKIVESDVLQCLTILLHNYFVKWLCNFFFSDVKHEMWKLKIINFRVYNDSISR